jgi:hypothetical protein
MNHNIVYTGGLPGCAPCCFDYPPDPNPYCGGGDAHDGLCGGDCHCGEGLQAPPEEVPNIPDNPDTIFGEYLINGRCEWIWCDIPCEYSECNTED